MRHSRCRSKYFNKTHDEKILLKGFIVEVSSDNFDFLLKKF